MNNEGYSTGIHLDFNNNYLAGKKATHYAKAIYILVSSFLMAVD